MRSPSTTALASVALVGTLTLTHALWPVGGDWLERDAWIVGGLAYLAVLAAITLASEDGSADTGIVDARGPPGRDAVRGDPACDGGDEVEPTRTAIDSDD